MDLAATKIWMAVKNILLHSLGLTLKPAIPPIFKWSCPRVLETLGRSLPLHCGWLSHGAAW